MKNISMVLIVSALALTACKKNKTSDTNSNNTAQSDIVLMHFEHVWADSLDFELNTDYVNPLTGDSLNFSTFKYYVSNVKLKEADGTYWVESNSYHLLDLSQENGGDFTLTNVPFGEYTDVDYLLGVDSTANVSGAQDGALSVSNNMFWTWNSGYIMLKAEGTSPQSGDGTFAYHLGGFSGSNNVVTAKSHNFGSNALSVTGNHNCQIHLSAAPETLWQTIGSVSNLSSIHMPGSSAKTMATDFFNAVQFEHIHE